MDKAERIDKLEEAQEKIIEAIALIEEAVDETSFKISASYYIVPHLANWVYGNNPYDESIPKIIQGIEDNEI